jgi:cell division septation protein DedD
LGWTRGKQASTIASARSEVAPRGEKPKRIQEDELTFYKTLKQVNSPNDEAMPVANEKKDLVRESPEKIAVKPVEIKTKMTGFALQISAFRDVGKAHELIDSLKNQGYPAFTRTGSGHEDEWHRVFVGPFASKERAEKTSTELVAKGFKEGFVTTLSP